MNLWINCIALIVLNHSFLVQFSLAKDSSKIEEHNCENQNECINKFRESGLEIVKKLREQGLTQFGRLDIEEYIEFIEKVKIVPKKSTQYPDGKDSSRISAIWHRETEPNYIEFSLTAWNFSSSEVRPLLALHEFLSLANYNDLDYQLSISLWFLMKTIEHNLLSPEQNQWVENEIILLASGGAVGVGGGGDFNAEQLKVSIINSSLDEMKDKITSEKQTLLIQSYLISRSIKIQMTYPQRGTQSDPQVDSK